MSYLSDNITEFCFFAIDNAEDVHLGEMLLKPQENQEALSIAAVLVSFWPDTKGNWHSLLTRRSQNLADHPGQIAFPGGKKEASDDDLIQTALRETHEEVGIESHNITVFGTLPTVNIPTGYAVSPVLSLLRAQTQWQAQYLEVAEILTIPTDISLNPDHYQIQKRSYRGRSFDTLALPFKHYDIWGATARILYGLALSHDRFMKASR